MTVIDQGFCKPRNDPIDLFLIWILLLLLWLILAGIFGYLWLLLSCFFLLFFRPRRSMAPLPNRNGLLLSLTSKIRTYS